METKLFVDIPINRVRWAKIAAASFGYFSIPKRSKSSSYSTSVYAGPVYFLPSFAIYLPSFILYLLLSSTS